MSGSDGGDEIRILEHQSTTMPTGARVKIRIITVPESKKFPEGIKYSMHYGLPDEEDPILRYDNAHGVHEKHASGKVEEIEFTSVWNLYQKFRNKVKQHEQERA